MYELWIATDRIIEGKRLGRASKSIDILKARAIKYFNYIVVFKNEMDTYSDCIWIDSKVQHKALGLIKKKGI